MSQNGECQRLLAVNALSGKVAWSVRVPSSNEDGPLVVGSTVYFATDDDLEARSLATGKLLWSLVEPCIGAPSYADDTLYLGIAGGLQAVSTVTHKQLWFRHTPFVFNEPPVVASGNVYGGYDWAQAAPGFGAYNASTGAVVWQNLTLQPLGGAAYGNNGLIYVDAQNGIDALSTASGAVQWTAFAGSEFEVDQTPTVADGVLYAAANDGTTGLFAADASTGSTLWSTTLGGADPLGAPTVVNGWVYVTDANDSIHAFEP
jgi:outer membrane protein assembly factor BamB